jgi:hypothetical protein
MNMAAHIGAQTRREEVNVGNTEQVNMNVGNETPTAGGMIGFMGTDVALMSASVGSEYTEKFATIIKEMYAKIGVNKPKVFVFDKEIIPDLGYSYIAIAQNDGNNVYYYTVMLTATGNKPLSSQAMYADFVESAKMNKPVTAYTMDQTIDRYVHELIVKRLSESYGNGNFIPVDGVIVNEANDLENIARRTAALGYNATKIEITLKNSQDLNITQALSTAAGSMFSINVTPVPDTAIKDEVDKPHKALFNITLDMVTRKTVNSVHMNSAGNRTLCNITGYIDAIPEEVTIQTGYGQPPITQIRLHPHVVITNIKTTYPTTGYLMMAIATALVMDEPDVLYPIIAKDPNVGALNIITNLEGSQNGVGKILDLSGKKVTQEEAIATIREMFTLKPLFSIDVDAFGADSFATSILSTASKLDGSPESKGAINKLLSTVVNLTNGAFPKDFPIGEIFADQSIVIPSGYYYAKDGEKDIKDLNLSFIAKSTADINMLNQYILGEFPRSKSGIDPFMNRLEFAAKLIPDALIDTRTTRVRFSGKFMATLLAAVRAAGFDPKYKPLMNYTADVNYAQIQNFIGNAVMETSPGFGRIGVNGNQFNYQTPNYGGGMGYNRWGI